MIHITGTSVEEFSPFGQSILLRLPYANSVIKMRRRVLLRKHGTQLEISKGTHHFKYEVDFILYLLDMCEISPSYILDMRHRFEQIEQMFKYRYD